MKRVYIAGALRTPIGKFLGGLADLSAVDLGVAVVRPLLERTGIDPARVDEVILGVGRQAGSGPNPARQVAVRSAVPVTSTAFTLNMACGSGLLSIIQGQQSIQRGDASIVIVGGMESMSRLPYYLEGARAGYRLGHGELVDGMYRDGFQCPLADQLMGATAENLVEEFDISRDEQDTYAVESQRRCQAARDAARFDAEMVAVEVPGRKGPQLIDTDEHPRGTASLDSMAKLKPVFKRDGSVHPGNSSGITDGAAALVLVSEEAAKELGLAVIAEVCASAKAGVEPERMGMGPVPAIRKLLEATQSQLSDFDLVELNEAFAAQVIACDREIGFDRDRLNVNGGAIALGHPIGATGARIVVTLVHEMIRRGVDRGLATLCISGGMGLALDVRAAPKGGV